MTTKNPFTLCLQIFMLGLLVILLASKTSAKIESNPQPRQHVHVIYTEVNNNPPVYQTIR